MDSAGWFECPTCHAKYDWLVQQAGRRVRCRCSTVLRIPAAPNDAVQVIDAPPPVRPAAATQEPPVVSPPSPDGSADVFKLSLETEKPELTPHTFSTSIPSGAASSPRQLRCANCGQSLSPAAALCVQCGTPVQGHSLNRPVNLELGQAVAELMEAPAAAQATLSTQQQSAQEALDRIGKKYDYARDVEHETVSRARFVDLFLPLILLVVGSVMMVTYVLGYQPQGALSIPMWGHVLLMGMNVVINFVFLLLGLFFVAKLFGDAIGTLGLTLWKLLGLVVFCVAADAMFYWGLDVITEGFAMLGGYVRIIFYVLVFFPLAGLLLGLDFMQLVVLFLFGRIMPVVVVVIAVPIILSLYE